MNTEYRNKLYNRIKDVFEKEDTQERQSFLEARENFNESQKNTFELARQVVERSYPKDDVATVVAKGRAAVERLLGASALEDGTPPQRAPPQRRAPQTP